MHQYNPYNPYYFNYQNSYPNYMSPQINRLNQMEAQYQGYQNSNVAPNINNIQSQILQGKAVDSVDVVKATDVPLDGSITYFPKTDGTAIYTKQLQADGTSRINTYEISMGNMPTTMGSPDNNVKKEDIDKIYSSFSELKQSLEENMNNLFIKFDDFKNELSSSNLHNDNIVSSNAKPRGGK